MSPLHMHDFSLLFSCVGTADTNSTIESLDLQHHLIIEPNGPYNPNFLTKNHVKPTAINRCFRDG